MMKYKKIKTSVVFLLLGLGGIQAQETTATTGGEATGTGGNSSYSIGQVLCTTNTGTNGSIAQGVQQPYEISTTVGIKAININLESSVYPNPTNDFLTLKIKGNEFSALSFQLFDMQGKLLESKQLANNSSIIKMKNLPKSTYFLKIIENNQLVKTYKIIKN